MRSRYQTIIFDLDGTLIDSRERLFRLFVDLIGNNDLTFDEYWDYKRGGKSNELFLRENCKWGEQAILNFRSEWMNKIESDNYLFFDKCFENTIPVLKELSADSQLFLVTARQYPDKVEKQLNTFGILGFFKGVIASGQRKTKIESIRSLALSLPNTIIVGDTGEETLTGRELGIITANVLTGFRNKEVLESFEPDFIFPDLSAFASHVLMNMR